MVTNGTHFNDGCCFDYGNAEIDNTDDGAATMEAVYFGNSHDWSYGGGDGPWVMADLENGLFGCDSNGQCSNTPSVQFQYVTAMFKGRSGGTFALKQGNAQSGRLQTTYDGARPSGYEVMQKQGAIILGIGGDNSNVVIGSFYEGVMVPVTKLTTRFRRALWLLDMGSVLPPKALALRTLVRLHLPRALSVPGRL